MSVLTFLCVLLWVSVMFLRRSYMIFWVIREACIRYGTVVNIVRAHLSRHKIVHLLGSFVDPISVDVTDNSEHWATDAAACEGQLRCYYVHN